MKGVDIVQYLSVSRKKNEDWLNMKYWWGLAMIVLKKNFYLSEGL